MISVSFGQQPKDAVFIRCGRSTGEKAAKPSVPGRIVANPRSE